MSDTWTVDEARRWFESAKYDKPNALEGYQAVRNLLAERDALVRWAKATKQNHMYLENFSNVVEEGLAWHALPEYLRKEIEDG